MIWRMDGEKFSFASASNAPRKERLQYACPQGRCVWISRWHSSALIAWKQLSGVARCIFISLMTMRGGRLLKITKAVSKRKIHVKILALGQSASLLMARCVSEPDEFFTSRIFLPFKLMSTHLGIVQMSGCRDSDISCCLSSSERRATRLQQSQFVRKLTETKVANLFRRIRLLLESVPSQFW